MRENKRKLKFKKIKIANMNSLKGGGETDTIVAQSDSCPSENVGCSPYPGSDINNPCSDTCPFVDTFEICVQFGTDTNTIFCERP